MIGLAVLFAASEAAAQFGGGGVPGGGGRRGGTRGDSTQRPTLPEPQQNLFQTSLEELRIDLKLDAAQQAAWNAYADKLTALMNDNARERARAQVGAGAAPQAAPQQLDQLVISAQNRATAIEDAVTAARTLYDKLAPEQKSIADGRLANITGLAASPPPEAARARR